MSTTIRMAISHRLAGLQSCRTHFKPMEVRFAACGKARQKDEAGNSEAGALWAGTQQASVGKVAHSRLRASRHAGVLRTKTELYAAAKSMIAALGDRYSEFLEPPAFRAAVRRPTQAELDYMASYAVGTPSIPAPPLK
jgi:hypothetical protein